MINKANENIKILIEKIIELKKSEMKGFCVNPELQNEIHCYNCDICTKKYFDNMFKEMFEKYKI